jgi:hypothetical protein
MIFVDMIKQADRFYHTGRRFANAVGLSIGCDVVVEAGLPGAEGRLDFEARRWLQAEGSNVTMAVTVVVWDDVERIVVKTWEYVFVPVATLTETGTGTGEEEKEIRCTQEVVIRRRNGKTVSSGFLRFPFKTIFGREPDPTKAVDRDIILEEKDLEKIGSRAWWEKFGEDVEDSEDDEDDEDVED